MFDLGMLSRQTFGKEIYKSFFVQQAGFEAISTSYRRICKSVDTFSSRCCKLHGLISHRTCFLVKLCRLHYKSTNYFVSAVISLFGLVPMHPQFSYLLVIIAIGAVTFFIILQQRTSVNNMSLPSKYMILKHLTICPCFGAGVYHESCWTFLLVQ